MKITSYLASAFALAAIVNAKPTTRFEKRIASSGDSHRQDKDVRCAGWQESCSSKACCNNWHCDPIKRICGSKDSGSKGGTKPKCCDHGKSGCTSDADCCNRGDKCVNSVCTTPKSCTQQGLGPECKVSGGCCKYGHTCKYGNTCVPPPKSCEARGYGPECKVSGGCCRTGQRCENNRCVTPTKTCAQRQLGPECNVRGGCCAKGETCKNGNQCVSGNINCRGKGPACEVEGGCCAKGKICSGSPGSQTCTDPPSNCPGMSCPSDTGKPPKCCPNDGQTYTCTKVGGYGKCVPAQTSPTCSARGLGQECTNAEDGCCPADQSCVDPTSGDCCRNINTACSQNNHCCGANEAGSNVLCNRPNGEAGTCVSCPGTKCLGTATSVCCPVDGNTYTCSEDHGHAVCNKQVQQQTCAARGLGESCSETPEAICCPTERPHCAESGGFCCQNYGPKCPSYGCCPLGYTYDQSIEFCTDGAGGYDVCE